MKGEQLVQRAGGHDVVTNECDCNGFNSSGIRAHKTTKRALLT